MANTNKPARRALVFGYLDQKDRMPLKKFLTLHKMQRPTFHVFEGEYNEQKKNLTKVEKKTHKRELRNEVMDAWDRVEGKEPPQRTANGYEIAEITEDEKVVLARKVYEDAMLLDASAKDKDLAIRMLGMLIEKTETKVEIGLTAEERIRRELQAERDLQEWERGMGGLGVQKVQEEPPLLPDNLCLDTGQCQAEDNQVAPLETSS